MCKLNFLEGSTRAREKGEGTHIKMMVSQKEFTFEKKQIQVQTVPVQPTHDIDAELIRFIYFLLPCGIHLYRSPFKWLSRFYSMFIIRKNKVIILFVIS